MTDLYMCLLAIGNITEETVWLDVESVCRREVFALVVRANTQYDIVNRVNIECFRTCVLSLPGTDVLHIIPSIHCTLRWFI
jgi:hypothetical protein